LFIAIIIQGYEETRRRINRKIFNASTKTRFRRIWSYFDKDATGFMHESSMREFLIELGKKCPLGWYPHKDYRDNLKK
jgi:Ca2+-binding EF-hand superfamily protein